MKKMFRTSGHRSSTRSLQIRRRPIFASPILLPNLAEQFPPSAHNRNGADTPSQASARFCTEYERGPPRPLPSRAPEKVQLLSTCVTLILRKSPPTPVLANTRRLDASPSTRSPRGTFCRATTPSPCLDGSFKVAHRRRRGCHRPRRGRRDICLNSLAPTSRND